jgi:hypothetical protein
MKMPKKLTFGEDGNVQEAIDEFKPSNVKPKQKSKSTNKIGKRKNLQKNKVIKEKEYFDKQFGDKKVIQDSKTVEDDEQEKNNFAREAALNYLNTFVNDKPNWKFQKVRQTWILRNLYYQHEINNEHFKYALSYMLNMGEKAKKETVAEAKNFLESKASEESLEITDTIRKRAKKIVKLL